MSSKKKKKYYIHFHDLIKIAITYSYQLIIIKKLFLIINQYDFLKTLNTLLSPVYFIQVFLFFHFPEGHELCVCAATGGSAGCGVRRRLPRPGPRTRGAVQTMSRGLAY